MNSHHEKLIEVAKELATERGINVPRLLVIMMADMRHMHDALGLDYYETDRQAYEQYLQENASEIKEEN
jgi:hypothetical protein